MKTEALIGRSSCEKILFAWFPVGLLGAWVDGLTEPIGDLSEGDGFDDSGLVNVFDVCNLFLDWLAVWRVITEATAWLTGNCLAVDWLEDD